MIRPPACVGCIHAMDLAEGHAVAVAWAQCSLEQMRRDVWRWQSGNPDGFA